jgi:hypothetical protein
MLHGVAVRALLPTTYLRKVDSEAAQAVVRAVRGPDTFLTAALGHRATRACAR